MGSCTFGIAEGVGLSVISEGTLAPVAAAEAVKGCLRGAAIDVSGHLFGQKVKDSVDAGDKVVAVQQTIDKRAERKATEQGIRVVIVVVLR